MRTLNSERRSKKLLAVIAAAALLLVAGSAAAQDSVVRAVKARLEATGVPLDGPCGAFEITKRVAWQLRATGAGTLDKPSGNNCGGRSVDIIAYPDGRLVDILSDAGGSNGPVWNPIEPVEASRWRAAVDPGDGPPAPPAPVTPSVDLTPLLSRLDALERTLQALTGTVPDLEQRVAQQGAALDGRIVALASALDRVRDRLTTVESRPIPIACSAALNLGAGRIPISCKLQ